MFLNFPTWFLTQACGAENMPMLPGVTSTLVPRNCGSSRCLALPKKETIPKAYQQLSNPLLCGEDLYHQIEIYSLCYFKNNDNLIRPYSFTDDEDDNEGDVEHNEAEERHNDENRDNDEPRRSKSPVNSFSSWLFLLLGIKKMEALVERSKDWSFPFSWSLS